MLFTGFADLESIIAAINQGHVYQFLKKPWQPEELETAVRQAAVEYDRLIAEADGERERLQPVIDDLQTRVDGAGGRGPAARRDAPAALTARRPDRTTRPRRANPDRIVMSSDVATPRPTPDDPTAGRAGARHTLLIVDDEVDVLESLRHLFHRAYRVLTAERRRPGASRSSSREDVHLILSDQRMPGMSGDVFLSHARQRPARRDPDALHRLRRHPGRHQRRQRRAHLPLHPQALGRRSSSKASSARPPSSTSCSPSGSG